MRLIALIISLFPQFKYYVCLCFSHFGCIQLFVSLGTVTHQAPQSMGFSRQENMDGLPCPPPGDLPNLGIKPTSPVAPALQADLLQICYH